MLWQRVLTAVPLAAVIIWVILFQPAAVFFWLSMLVAMLAAWEWARLSGGNALLVRAGFTLAVTAMTGLFSLELTAYAGYLVYAAVAWWLLVCVLLFRTVPVPMPSAVSWRKLASGLLVIPAAVVAMIQIRASSDGAEWLMYGLMLVWIADIGAYFSGKRFGKHKLAPRISPGKTLEGLAGAVIAVVLYTLIAAWYFRLEQPQTVMLILLAMVLTLVSVAGDLYESILKRERGMKDSGTILPGHGGVLDRIDSVLAAMPVFAVGFTALVQRGQPL